MKPRLALLLLPLIATSAILLAQGPLTPPAGAPAPTMKTLDQVEARKPLGPSTTSLAINAPGSYYLAGDIVPTGSLTGITISSGDVTLDLNGFAIRKAAGATGGTGISLSGPTDNSGRNITLRNGHISGPFGNGIALTRVHNVAIEDVAIQGTTASGISGSSALDLTPNSLTVRRCRILGEPVDRVPGPVITAMTNAGIDVRFAGPCLIEDCVIANVAGNGIRLLTANSGDSTSSGIVRGSVISRCGGNGIDLDTNASTSRGVLVERCTIDQCGADGVAVLGAVRIVDCTVVGNTGSGIRCANRLAMISGCIVENNLANGIQVGSDSRVTDNTCDGNGSGTSDGAGILVTGAGCRIEGNHVSDADRGIDVDGTGNLIIRNSASANTTNYDIVANNKVGAIVAAPNSVAITGSTGGAGVGTTDPWANISY